MKDLRIALVVCNSPVGEIRRNLDAMAESVRKAAAGGAALVCFPELNVTGYCNQKNLSRIAVTVPGRTVDEIARIAASENMVILAGIAEKGPDGNLYAAHLVIEPGGIAGVYRKLYIAPPERKIFTPGRQIPLFESRGVRFGIQLCYDAHFPELSAHMAAAGADLIFVPHASPRGNAAEKHRSWMRHLPARAYDNGVFIAACNQVGENCKGLSFPGNALVIAPSGTVIGKALTGREDILFADLQSAALARVRGHEMRYFFPNRRPELYEID